MGVGITNWANWANWVSDPVLSRNSFYYRELTNWSVNFRERKEGIANGSGNHKLGKLGKLGQ